jgi:transcription antitermination factor NusG
MSDVARWFAVLVQPRHEIKVLRNLSARGLDEFVPLCRVRHQWSERVKMLRLPIFSGYVFCRFGRQEHRLVVDDPSVWSVARDSRAQITISDADIDALKMLSASELKLCIHEYVEDGEIIVIDQGHLSGMQVFAVENNGVVEFIKSFHSFRQSVLCGV